MENKTRTQFKEAVKADKMIAPTRLNMGDKVAIVAPSSYPSSGESLKDGLTVLQQAGLKPIVGENLNYMKTKGFYSAPLEDRVSELMWAIKDPEIKGIFCATGGFGCSQLLPELDYRAIRAARKPLMGSSDITALTNAFAARAGLIAFNGPTVCASKKGREGDIGSFEAAVKLLMSMDNWGELPWKDNPLYPATISPGISTGIAIGGNLTTYINLIGTRYFPLIDGAVLFMEDRDVGGYDLMDHLNHMKLAGIINRLAGVVAGEFVMQPEDVAPEEGDTGEVLVEFLSDGPPAVTGYNFNHGDTSAVIPIGAAVTVDADNRKVVFDFTMEG